MNERIKEDLRSIIQLLIGCFVYSISISVFYSPTHILGGGVTGIAQILHYEFGVSISTMIVLINIPLFILALILIDRRFTIFSLAGMMLMSLFIHLTSGWSMEFSSPLTSIVVGGVINGLGLGIIYRSEASAGGTDIISKVIQRYFAGNMAHVGLMINVAVVGVSAFIYGMDQAVLTICAMYISSQVDSYIIDGIDHRRAIDIVTNEPDRVSKAILEQLRRGVTVFKGYGAYTKSERPVLRCVITRRELAKIKRIVKAEDPNSFMTITRLTGVYGKGRGFHSINKDIK